jgi:putative oxidoreductase
MAGILMPNSLFTYQEDQGNYSPIFSSQTVSELCKSKTTRMNQHSYFQLLGNTPQSFTGQGTRIALKDRRESRDYTEVCMLYRLIRTRNDSMIAILRLTLGVIFLAHGSQKMLGMFRGPGIAQTLSNFEMMGIPTTLGMIATLAEFAGGLGLVVGFLSRIAALGIVTNMAVAIAMVHAPHGLFMNWDGTGTGQGFEFHLLAIAMGLSVLVRGAGAFSIDLELTNGETRRVMERTSTRFTRPFPEMDVLEFVKARRDDERRAS